MKQKIFLKWPSSIEFPLPRTLYQKLFSFTWKAIVFLRMCYVMSEQTQFQNITLYSVCGQWINSAIVDAMRSICLASAPSNCPLESYCSSKLSTFHLIQGKRRGFKHNVRIHEQRSIIQISKSKDQSPNANKYSNQSKRGVPSNRISRTMQGSCRKRLRIWFSYMYKSKKHAAMQFSVYVDSPFVFNLCAMKAVTYFRQSKTKIWACLMEMTFTCILLLTYVH